jgi:TPR repeat protein
LLFALKALMSSRLWRLAPALALLVACQSSPLLLSPSDVRPMPGLYDSKVDKGLSFNALKAQADAGDKHAQNQVGATYGAEQPDKALPYYRLAAAQGLAVAQCNLGYMHLIGQATARDPAQAAQWFGRCAQQGHFMGQFALGRMYLDGMGVPKDARRAEQWWLLSAAQGHLDSQRALRLLYTQGAEGFAPQPQQAALWAERVAAGVMSGKPWKEAR